MKLHRTVAFILMFYYVECYPCNIVESLDITNGTRYSNDSIIFNGVEYTSDVWFEYEEDNVTAILGCPCIGRVCLWKCCDSGQAFIGRQCLETDLAEVNPFNPPVFTDLEQSSLVSKDHFFFMYNNKLCESRYPVYSNLDNMKPYIQQDGSLLEVIDGRQLLHRPTEFCVDMIMPTDGTEAWLMAAVCTADDDVNIDDSKIVYILYAVGLLFSAPFLLMTFLVYALIPELRNLHGMCLMAYCAGLIVGYPALAYLKMYFGSIAVGKSTCIVIAFIVYYAFQTSFFWLNVMCYDIWRTFRGYRGGSSKKRNDYVRFARYGAYAWGMPMILTALTAYMQFGGLPDYILKPGLGNMKCWFEDWRRDLLYFYSPVIILVICNTMFFLVTAYRIRSIKQETAILKGAESARSDRLKKEKHRYGLYLRLFMVMGVNWVVELVGSAVGGSNWYWAVVDISNLMLGFFIFLIFVWKKKVRNMVRARLRCTRGVRSHGDSTWGRSQSSAPTEDTRLSGDDAVRLKDMKDSHY